MDDSKNSRRTAAGAESSPDFPTKNSRRHIARKTGAAQGDPSEAPPSMPSKNSRQVMGAKIAPSEGDPSTTPADAVRYGGIARPGTEGDDHKTAGTTLQEGGKNIPFAVGGATPPERPDIPHGQSNSDQSGSPANLSEVEGKHDQSGSKQPTPSQEGGHDDNDSSASIAELSAKLEAMKRQQRASALRGALLVFLPPVILCIPLVILKACNLLLLSWWWCISPLLLWLIPIASLLSIFVQCYRLFKQQEGKDKGVADKETERG